MAHLSFNINVEASMRKGMQEKESIMVVRCRLKILSLGITVRHHSAKLMVHNSDPWDRFFYLYLTTMIDSYITQLLDAEVYCY